MTDNKEEALLERFVSAIEKIADELEVIRYIAAEDRQEEKVWDDDDRVPDFMRNEDDNT